MLDPNVIQPNFVQNQQRNYYGFPAKMDIDRYTTDKETRDYVVGLREIEPNNLDSDQRNWINKYTVYTHGYGVVAAQADKSVNVATDYAVGNLPVTGFLKDARQGVYFGELGSEYAIVGAQGTPREDDGSETKVTYSGTGGVKLGNVFTRAAFALKYRETNFLLNDAVSARGREDHLQPARSRTRRKGGSVPDCRHRSVPGSGGRQDRLDGRRLHDHGELSRTRRSSLCRTSRRVRCRKVGAPLSRSRARSTTSATRSRRPWTP